MANFIKPCNGRVTSPFGYRIHPVRKKREMHWGVDYGNYPQDNTIVAVADGIVSDARVLGGYGNVIMILHNIDGITYESVYAHLATMSVRVGSKVKQGQKIGIKGTTGTSTGIHLHFELHKNGRRSSLYTFAVDPLQYLSDEDVLEYQKLLKQCGFNISVDGINGAMTNSIVKDFQKKYGLQADGIVGSGTLSKLKEIANSIKVVNPPKKLMWGKTEFKKGQIGKLTIIKKINLWSDGSNGKLKMERVLLPTEEYRVYGYRNDYGGQYNVGGGMWVTKMPTHIKYETPSKQLLKEAEKL